MHLYPLIIPLMQQVVTQELLDLVPSRRVASQCQSWAVGIGTLRRKGVRVVSITEHADDSPTGKLMEAIIESVDEFYSENLA